MKIRIKYRKVGLMQFVGHLDMMRAWQKIFRRSGIPIAYSEGFNPHQIFSIGAPTAVGTTSDGEYLDLKLKVDSYEMDTLISRINHVCPEGIEVLDAIELVGKQTAAMAACQASSYVISLSDDLAADRHLLSSVDAFVSKTSIVVKKKNKKGKINDLDIKPGIFSCKAVDTSIHVILATGSSLNVKPDIFMKALFDYTGVELSDFTRSRYYEIHRLETYSSIDPYKNLIEGVVNE